MELFSHPLTKQLIVSESTREVFIDPDDKADFHIRAGTTAQMLNPKEATAYIKDHFQNR